MSEIKGSLLGIILTITIFGVVIGTMAGMFQTVTDIVGDRMTSVAEENYVETNNGN